MFNTLILITGITSALPYFLTAMASMYLLLARGQRPHPAALARDLGVTLVAAIFSIWCIVGSGILPVIYAAILIAVGYVVYGLDRKKRRRTQMAP